MSTTAQLEGIEFNQAYNDAPRLSGGGDFVGPPSIILHGIEGVRSVLANPSIVKRKHPFQYRVKSPWIIEIIDQIVGGQIDEIDGHPVPRRDFAYNIDVQIVVERKLGTGRTEKQMREDPTVLSTLVYNAQNFRRSDDLREEGYEPLTQEMIGQAHAQKRKIELKGGTFCNTRVVNGKVYLFEPRKRKYAIAPGNFAAKIV